MRRSTCLLLLVLAACGERPVPRVGVVISARPAQVVPIAAAHAAGTGGPVFEPVIQLTPEAASAETALQVAEALVSDPAVIAVIGHSNSAASLAASQVYNAAGIVQIAPTTTAPVYDETGPFSFRMVPSDTAQARFIVDALYDGLPADARVAVVYVNDDYGRGLYRYARPHIRSTVFEGMYADVADTTNLYHLGDRVAAARPDIVLWLGRPWRLRNFLAQLRPVLPDVAVLCSDACDEPTMYQNANGEFTGVRFVQFLDPHAAAAATVQAEYSAVVREMATAEALLAYDAARLIAAAIADGADSGEDVRRWLVSLGRERPAWQGITGLLSFEVTGTARRSYRLARVVGRDSVVSTVPGR
ncbi:MAG TPA: ABC transporter substrate-binding protein [Longimicrobiales bacterium]|nr:ABC transporter substrate-binding protein [Longimicrobiales bacterium]